MEEVKNLLWFVICGGTGLYLLYSALLTRGNPDHSVLRTLFWSVQLFFGVSLLVVPFLLQWLSSIIE